MRDQAGAARIDAAGGLIGCSRGGPWLHHLWTHSEGGGRFGGAPSVGAGHPRLAMLQDQVVATLQIACPPPRPGLAPSAIRELLHRPFYRGEVVWNKRKKTMRGGTKRRVARPAAEWLHLDAPALQIVPADLWQAAHARLDSARRTFVRGADGQLLGRPTRLDLESPYLLSGFGRCALCGGAIIAMTRGFSKHRGRFYGCSYHHKQRGQYLPKRDPDPPGAAGSGRPPGPGCPPR